MEHKNTISLSKVYSEKILRKQVVKKRKIHLITGKAVQPGYVKTLLKLGS